MDSLQSFDSIKPAENDNIRVAFHEFDTDKDGLLSCFEFERSLIRYGWKLGVNPIKLDIEKVFKEADSDGDDLIDYAEYTEIIHNIN
jgi:Ca2+-binding EF-hand superfamily protein